MPDSPKRNIDRIKSKWHFGFYFIELAESSWDFELAIIEKIGLTY